MRHIPWLLAALSVVGMVYLSLLTGQTEPRCVTGTPTPAPEQAITNATNETSQPQPTDACAAHQFDRGTGTVPVTVAKPIVTPPRANDTWRLGVRARSTCDRPRSTGLPSATAPLIIPNLHDGELLGVPGSLKQPDCFSQPRFSVRPGHGVVLTYGAGYGVPKLRRFVLSLRMHDPATHVVLFTDDITPAVHAFCEDTRVEAVRIDAKLLQRGFHPSSARFVVLDAWMESQPEGRWDAVLHADVRDTVFQGAPFDIVTDSVVYGALEASTWPIEKCPYNSDWLPRCSGDALLRELRNESVSCAGTTIGAWPPMRRYVSSVSRGVVRSESGHAHSQPVTKRFLAQIHEDYVQADSRIVQRGCGPRHSHSGVVQANVGGSGMDAA